jgi:hypothetical protein
MVGGYNRVTVMKFMEQDTNRGTNDARLVQVFYIWKVKQAQSTTSSTALYFGVKNT